MCTNLKDEIFYQNSIMQTKMIIIGRMIISSEMITVRLKLLIKASGLMIAIKGFLTVAKKGKQGAPDSTGACLMGAAAPYPAQIDA